MVQMKVLRTNRLCPELGMGCFDAFHHAAYLLTIRRVDLTQPARAADAPPASR